MEAVQIILREMGAGVKERTKVSELHYKDVTNNDYEAEQIANATELGLINGFKDRTFRPNKTITRGQTVKVFNNTYDINQDDYHKEFSDVNSDHWTIMKFKF